MRKFCFILFLLLNLPGFYTAQSDTFVLLLEEAELDLPSPPDNQERISADNLDNLRLLSVISRYRCPCFITCDGVSILMEGGRSYASSFNSIFDLRDFSYVSGAGSDLSSHGTYTASGYPANYERNLSVTWQNIETQESFVFEGNETSHWLRNISFSDDETLIVIVTYTDAFSQVNVLDTSTGNELYELRIGRNAHVWINGDKIIVSEPEQDTIEFIDLYSGDRTRAIFETEERLISFDISPDNKWLVEISFEGTQGNRRVSYWNLEDETMVRELTVTGNGSIYSRFSPIPDVLITSDGQQIQVWHLLTGELLRSIPATSYFNWRVSPDGQFVALSNPARIIDLVSGETTILDGYYSGDVLFDPTGSTLIVNSSIYSNDTSRVMLAGIPSQSRPEWRPTVTAHVVPSSISVRELPEQGAEISGVAQGDVLVSAVSYGHEAVYLPEYGGWVWTNPAFLEIDEEDLYSLPIRISTAFP